MRMRLSLFVIALVVGACSPMPSSLGEDGGLEPVVDAGMVRDAGVVIDAGVVMVVDAGLDAGLVQVDAGAPVDAGTLDAGTPVDAGAVVDAGQPVDAGTLPELDAGPPNILIVVDPTTLGTQVPDDFLGLSVEWNHVTDYLADGAGTVRPLVVNLLSNFAADGHTPLLRIGGNSEDKAYWNPTAGALPSGATISVENTHLSILSALHTATGSRFILGLNLARSDAANAAALVQAADTTLGASSVAAYELGNEPDLYFYPMGYRPFYYSLLGYQSDVDGYWSSLPTGARYASPAVYDTTWLSGLSGFLLAERTHLSLVTVHHYPFNVCLTMVGAPTIPTLFTAAATTDYARLFAPFVVTAGQSGLKLRVAEMNSISCGGVTGVSDVFGAGLWGLDSMFQLASIGAAGVNLHGPSRYSVFDIDSTGALKVRGLYYAMLLFSRATSHQGRLVPVTVTGTFQVRAWATVGSDGHTRVAVVNEDFGQTAQVSLTIPSHVTPGTQWQLTAPSMSETTNIHLGAQTFQGSTDGLPLGSSAGDVVRTQQGAYRVTLTPGSATVIDVP
jgi:hypothetical protein